MLCTPDALLHSTVWDIEWGLWVPGACLPKIENIILPIFNSKLSYTDLEKSELWLVHFI